MLDMDSAQETLRIRRLHDIGILDTENDDVFRGFAEQALASLPGTCIAAVTLIDTDRQWFKTIVGLDVKETARSHSFCTHTIQSSGTMVVEDATRDERFASNPFVTSAPDIRFYAGVKLTSGIGALCVLGKKPRRVTDDELSKLKKLAQFVDIQMLAHGTLFNLK
ncbi:hypothetical protein Sa4125_17030 [Aureimonas sp. SA4125]|uniref:GAF domain-containing protein n=1 Tax=Aureimonas sp. SA4125 TaxID=2826993 RepID=UPI001CC7A841|nr:GAF domain-containing protein [Aureimonas sp. SA4125]BDA84161.1 hypothetical protein Sa4125_17030 [Aureimonas sp. SA4125]